MEFVKGPVPLELYLLVLQMNKKNSVVSRGPVMNVGDLGLGVIVMVVRESNKVFSRDECLFFFVWMLAEGRLYLLNATAREQYKRDHPDNEQRVLMEMLAKTVTDLEKGLSDDQIIAAVEDKISEALTIADEELWKIMTGVEPLCDGMSKIISKANRRLPKTPKLDAAATVSGRLAP